MASVLNDEIKGAELLRAAIVLTRAEIRGLAEDSRKIVGSFKFETSDDLKNLDKEIDQVTNATKKLIEVEREDAKLKKDLVNLEKAQQQALQAKNRTNIQVRKEQERQEKIAKKLTDTNNKLTGAYARERKELIRLEKEFKDLIITEGKATKETERLRKSVLKIRGGIDRANGQIGRFNDNVGNYKSALAGSLGTAGQFATATGAIAAGVLIAGKAIGSAIGIIKGFEQANANLQAVLGKTKEEMQPLVDQAKALGAITAFSASEVTGLQTELAKLGFPISDIQQMAASTLDAATAMGSDLAAQAALTGATLRSFNLDASQTQKVNDVLAKATSASALDFDKLNASMSTIAPVAASFGFSLEGTTALLGELSNAGFDASSAATATRNILLNLADSNGKLAKSLGGPVKNLPSLVKGLKDLQASGIDLGEALQLTDKRSVAAFSTFLKGTDSVLELNQTLLKAGGTAEAMALTQLDTLEGSVKILNSSWEGLILSMEDGSGTMNAIATETVQDLAKGLSIISGESREAKDQFSIFGFILNSIKLQFTVFIGALKLVTLPLRIMIDVVRKLASRFEFLDGLFQSTTENVQILIFALNNLPEIADIVIDQVVKAFSRLSDVVIGVIQIFTGLFNGVRSGFKSIVRVAKSAGKVLAAALNPFTEIDLEEAFENFKRELGKGFFDAATSTEVKAGIKAIKDAFGAGFDDLGPELKARLLALVGSATEGAVDAAENLGEETGKAIGTGIKKGLSEIDEDIKKSLEDRPEVTLEINTEDAIEESRKVFDFIAEGNKQIVEAEKEREEELAKIRKKSAKAIIDGLAQLLEAQIEAQREASKEREKIIDDDIKASEKRSSRLERLAENEDEDLRKNLAFEQRTRAQLEARREKEIAKQKIQELELTALKTFAANLENNPNTAFTKTITDVTLLIKTIKNLSGFYEGTEMLGNDASPVLNTGKDDYVIRADGGERIMTNKQNKMVGGMSNDSLAELAYKSRTGKLAQSYASEVIIEKKAYQSNENFLNEFRGMKNEMVTAINNIPYDELKIDKMLRFMAVKHKRGNKTKTDYYPT